MSVIIHELKEAYVQPASQIIKFLMNDAKLSAEMAYLITGSNVMTIILLEMMVAPLLAKLKQIILV